LKVVEVTLRGYCRIKIQTAILIQKHFFLLKNTWHFSVMYETNDNFVRCAEMLCDWMSWISSFRRNDHLLIVWHISLLLTFHKIAFIAICSMFLQYKVEVYESKILKTPPLIWLLCNYTWNDDVVHIVYICGYTKLLMLFYFLRV